MFPWQGIVPKVSSEASETPPTNCLNCGAVLTPSGKCEYCGAVYHFRREQNRYIRIEVERPEIKALEATVSLDNEMYFKVSEQDVAGYVAHAIREQMMDNLAAFIRYDKSHDPFQNKTLIRARLRVVEPDFKF